MSSFYLGVAVFVFLNMLIGGLRILLGPEKSDRMLATQFVGTSAVAIFLLLAEGLNKPEIRNLALVFVALATITSGAFTQIFAKSRRRK